ncbi:MAG: TraB/GumN family protein [Woeseiaceae bacterium]|nr:TraB/GumN family protein [Woeseiaceae bacterium]
MIKALLPAVLACLAVCASAVSIGAEQRLPVWKVSGESNDVYLLGSVHLLREQDYPLPAGIDEAYADAEVLIMEIDMDDFDPAAAQALVSELGTIANGGSLAQLMGESLYEQARADAAALNIPLDALAVLEPWLAAITIEQLMLQRIGFNPDFGVEAHFVGRAAEDGKEILGLEELSEQLGFLDGLSIEAQRLLLLQTLDEASDLESMMGEMIAAWRRGDVRYLEENMLADMQQYPELYDAIVVSRNRNWTNQIADLLDDPQDYLIIVGALHLIGEDGVPAALDARGYETMQLSGAD